MEPDLLSSDLREQVAQPLLNGLSRLATAGRRPVVLLNGPVGAGKSTLGRALRTLAPATGLRLAVASIDDAYLPLEERRRRLAGNPFGVSRVPPGSHDVELLLDRLARWRSGSSLRLPVFDKTLAAGEGERAGEATHEADALVLEGWLVGCRSIGAEALKRGVERLSGWSLRAEELDWLPHWDDALENYLPLWNVCDGLWLLRPTDWTWPYRWRFQAEARQRRRGGGWLTSVQLQQLVRASLHSLPPPLYQEPLAEQGVSGSAEPRQRLPLWGITRLDGRRRCLKGPQPAQACSSSVSSAIG